MHTVLVVDDEEDVLFLLRINLSLKGFTVHEARDGEEAVALALQLRPDCVLLDWMMPGMDGLDVCRSLRSDPRTRDTAIIFLSAKARPEDQASALEAGADDYVVKPFEMDDLAGRIESALAARGETSASGG